MSPGGQTVQLIDLFRAIAEKAGARAALPLRDGSILFRFGAESAPQEVFYSPWRRPRGLMLEGIEGSFFLCGTARDLSPQRARLLARPGLDFPMGLDPLALRQNSDTPIKLDADFARIHLAPFFRAGNTAWGQFLFTGCDPREDEGVALIFEGRSGRLLFSVRPADKDSGAGWHVIPPLALRLEQDGRERQASTRFDQRVENYLYYAFSRSFRPDQPLPPGRRRPSRGRTTGRESPAESPGAGQSRRDDADEMMRERLEEVPEQAFFLDGFFRRIDTPETLGTLLHADDGLALVVHTEKECTTKLPWLRSCGHFRYMYSRLVPMPTWYPGKYIHWLEPSQTEIVMGDESNLVKALRKAAAAKKTKMVALMGTCLGDVTGCDYQGLAQAAELEFGKPVVVISQMLEHFLGIDETWEMLFKIARKDLLPEPGRINLVGYAPLESDFAAEVAAVLPGLGLELNAFLIPSFDTRQAENFGRAAATVINPARSASFELTRAMAIFPEARFVRLPPPFGRSACLDFYRGLAELAGSEDAVGRARELWEPYSTSFEQWRERAQGAGVCLLVRPEDARYLHEPEEIHGIDLLRVLGEFGFSVEIFLLAGEEAEHVRQRIEARVVAEPLLAGRARVEREAPSKATAILSASDARLCFSEFPPDRRVLDAGKMFFQPRDFEPGLAGAVRSIARLVRLSRGGFPAAFRRVFAGTGRHR